MNSLSLPEIEHIGDFVPVQVICKFHKVSIKTKQAILRTRSNFVYLFNFWTKEQIPPKSIVRSDWNSNSSEILCLPMLSANFLKIRLKLKRLCSGQDQIWCFCHSRAINSEVKSPIKPEIELVYVEVACPIFLPVSMILPVANNQEQLFPNAGCEFLSI